MSRRLALLAKISVVVLAACSDLTGTADKSAAPGRVNYSSAAVPQTTIVEVDETFTNTFDCPFPLEETVRGAYKDMFYSDVAGNPVKEIITAQYRGSLTVT